MLTPFPHEVAVRLLDDITEMNADADLDALLHGKTFVPLREAFADLERAADGLDHAAKFDDCAVAGAFDEPPIVGGDGRIDQFAAQAPEPRQRTLFVRAHEPAVADNVGRENRRELSVLAHRLFRHDFAPAHRLKFAIRPALIPPL